jgi:ATP-dependent Clp protease ATP-binding subunit ClpA
MNAFSKELEYIKKKAGSTAFSFFQTWVGTPHIFLTLMSFLKEVSQEERYAQTYIKLKELLNSYEINGKSFQESFLNFFPKGLEPVEGENFEIVWHHEGQDLFNNLTREAMAQKREMQVEDLIRVLFADKSYRLHIVIEAMLGSTVKVDELFTKIIAAFKEEARKEIKELEKIKELRNLNKFVKEKPPVVIGADNTVNQIQLGLVGKSVSSVILVGPAGTGKTVSVLEFAKRINDLNVIEEMRSKVIYQLNPGSLVAGTRYRGDFEEKLMNIIKLVKSNPDVILFIDEAHQMVELGGADGASSAGNIIKEFISSGEIQMIWATTDTEYSKYIDKDKALSRRFFKVNVTEPSREETKQILMGILPSIEAHFKRKGSEEIVDKIIDIAEKYTLDQANPAKSVAMLELAFQKSKVFNEKGEVVFGQDILDAIKIKYDINISETKTKDTSDRLNSFILGQEKPLEKVVNNLRFVERGLVDLEKPLISMIFAGPTGY